MLDDPSYESIVRWGEGGESFVVLEVCTGIKSTGSSILTCAAEREVYQVDPTETFQAQQFCEFRPTVKQV
jgi:hypothetical protein